MATLNVSMSSKVILPSKTRWTNIETPRLGNMVTYVRKGNYSCGRLVGVVGALPDKLSESIEQSVKVAQETCAENPESGECAAAWDEVEEVSAAASHARDRNKSSDVLEDFCKDNPETDECRTYDN